MTTLQLQHLQVLAVDKTDTRKTGDTVPAPTSANPNDTAPAPQRNQGAYDVYSAAALDIKFKAVSDTGVAFGTQIDIDTGEDFDTSDVEFDGDNVGTPSFSNTFIDGSFGKITFDRDGIDDLYDDRFGRHDISYSLSAGAFSVDITADVNGVIKSNLKTSTRVVNGTQSQFGTATLANAEGTSGGVAQLTDPRFGSTYSVKLGYSALGAKFTLKASDAPDDPFELDVEYAVSDSLTVGLNYDTDAADRTEQVTTNGRCNRKYPNNSWECNTSIC